MLAVKIAQMYALRIDFLSEEKCMELSKLYRFNDPVTSEDLLSQIDKKAFDWIDEKPLATASVGQVHRAKLKNGRETVVKIIKQDFKTQFLADIRQVRRWVKIALFFYPKLQKVFNPLEILEHIETNTMLEIDLKNEIKGQEILKNIQKENRKKYDLSLLKFPHVYKDLSNQQILVTEWIGGDSLDFHLGDSENKLPYKELLKLFKIHGFYMFNIGIFHGDMHPGNVLLWKNAMYFIDTGAVNKISERLSKGLFSFFEALADYDYPLCAQRLNQMSLTCLEGAMFERFEKKFCNLYSDFKNKTVSEVSLTKRMMQTIKMAIHGGMSFETGMFQIIKSLMFLDGMVIKCKPDAILIKDMKPFIEDFKKVMG